MIRPRLEALEERLALVIGAYVPNPVPPGFVTVDGVPLDGVVQITLNKPGDDGICTGSLLSSQRHILSAAHCFTDDNGNIDVTGIKVTFTFAGWPNPIEYFPSDVQIHPGWNGDIDNGNDIAVLTLPTLAPSGPAGLGTRGYSLYSSFDEAGKQFEFAGFGRTGGGDTGGIDGTTGMKRLGYNRFDTRTNPVPILSNTGLAFDFDDGSVFNNTLVAWGSPKTPVKIGDSMIGKGDSGGPSFLNGRIAGVASGTYAFNDTSPDGTFGDVGVVERVSLHNNWINGFQNAGHHLTIRMDQQRPADGVNDTLKLLREGTNLVFYVNDQFYHFDASSRLSSVTIVGGSDSEDFHIDSDLRKIVNFQGGGGTNRVFVRDSSGPATYEVSQGNVSTIIGLRALTLNYDKVQHVEVAGGSSDHVKVNSVRSGTPVTVVGAGTVDIGVRKTGNLGTIGDTVTVNGPRTTLYVNDDSWTSRRDYDLFQDRLMVDLFGVARTIRFSGLNVMELTGGTQGNFTDVFATPAVITRLHTGVGDDLTQVHAMSAAVLAIDGQAGLDTVNVGSSGNAQGVLGSVRIGNPSGFTTVNINNQADASPRTVTMSNAVSGSVSIEGLTPGTIRVASDAVRRLNMSTGDGNDTFTIKSTPQSFPPLSFGTTIRSGGGNDHFNVHRTVGALTIETGGGTNLVTVGSNANGLNDINGEVTLNGLGGATSLLINDAVTVATPTMPSYAYIVDSSVVQRTDKGAINYQNMARLTLFTSQATDFVTVRDTAQFAADSRTLIATSGGDNFVTLRGTTGELHVDLGTGTGSVAAGDAANSLDPIRGTVALTGAGFDVNISNQAETTSQIVTVSRDTLFGLDSEKVVRQELVDGAYVTLNTFNVAFTGSGGVQYFAGQGGDTMFVSGTQANVITDLFGHAGVRDTFAIGFAGDMNQILGAVSAFGQSADYDFAYYYEYLNPNSHTYTISTNPFMGTMLFQRAGIAFVQFGGLNQVVFYTPLVGGNVVNIQGVIAPTFLNMAAGEGDVVTIGSDSPFLGGPTGLAGIQGPVQVGSYQYGGGGGGDGGDGGDDAPLPPHLGAVTMIVDNSGNGDLTPRRAELLVSPVPHSYYEALRDLAPATINWNLGPGSSVAIRGGAADETFALLSTSFITPISIEGGGGSNTLDYSTLEVVPGAVSWYQGQGNANDSTGGNEGITYGVSFVEGRVGKAFDFDGIGDYVDLGNDPSLDLPGNMSVSLWVRQDSLDHYKYFLADFDSPGGNVSQGSMGTVTDGSVFAWYQSYTDGTGMTLAGTTPIQLNRWYHLAAVRDDAAKTVRLFVNGVEEGSISYAAKTVVSLQGSKLLGGAGPSFPADFMDGQLDEVAIYNRDLNISDIQTLYTNGSTGIATSGHGVVVNLQTQTVTGLEGGIANIQTVIGSAGNDILVGDGGNVLLGGAGRDLLIAGALASYLYGGGDEDILIGGTTDYDTDLAALDAILAAWSRTDEDYDTRVAGLTSSTGVRALNDSTVTRNGGSNSLDGEGGEGRDLFFAAFGLDEIFPEEDETVVPI